MSYSSGMRKYRITVLNRKAAKIGKYGVDSSGAEWEETTCLWADVQWAKGKTALNAGAVDAYGVELVRMLWTNQINIRSRIVFQGQTYQIMPETFHPDKQDNTLQFNMQLVINDDKNKAASSPIPSSSTI